MPPDYNDLWEHLPADVNDFAELQAEAPDTSHNTFESYTDKGDVSTISDTNAFYAKLCNESYESDSDRIPYIQDPTGHLYVRYNSGNADIEEHLLMYVPYSNEVAYNNVLHTYCVFRGSSGLYDWMRNAEMVLDYTNPAHTFGWNTAFQTQKDALGVHIQGYLSANEHRNLILLGHSAGGFLATSILNNPTVLQRTVKCTTFNIFALPNDDYETSYLRCVNPVAGSTDEDYRNKVYHHLIDKDYSSSLVRVRGFGHILKYNNLIGEAEPGFINSLSSAVGGPAYLVYLNYANHTIINFTKSLDGSGNQVPALQYPVHVYPNPLDNYINVNNELMFGTELLGSMTTNYGGQAGVDESLKLVYEVPKPDELNGLTVKKFSVHNQHDFTGVDALELDEYKWTVSSIPPSHYTYYVEDSVLYFSRRYHFTNNGETDIMLYLHHTNIDTDTSAGHIIVHQVRLILENKTHMLQLNNGPFDTVGQYPWECLQPTIATYTDGTHGANYLTRGLWKLWPHSMVVGLDASTHPEGASTHPSDDYRRILHHSLAPSAPSAPTPTVGTEIEHGKTYKIWSVNTEYRTSAGSTSGNDIFLRRIACEIGTTWGYSSGTTLGDSKLAMCVDKSTTGLNDEWACERIDGTAEIKLTCNSTQLKVALMPVNDLGDTYPDVTINGNMYLTADASGILTDNLANPSGGFNAYSIRGLATNGNLVMAESRSFYWSSPSRDPVVPAIMPTPPAAPYSGTTGAQYWLFEEVVSSGIP